MGKKKGMDLNSICSIDDKEEYKSIANMKNLSISDYTKRIIDAELSKNL